MQYKKGKMKIGIIDKDKMEDIKRHGFEEFHCIGCGRFLGYHNIRTGMCAIYCKKCKNFTVIMPNM